MLAAQTSTSIGVETDIKTIPASQFCFRRLRILVRGVVAPEMDGKITADGNPGIEKVATVIPRDQLSPADRRPLSRDSGLKSKAAPWPLSAIVLKKAFSSDKRKFSCRRTLRLLVYRDRPEVTGRWSKRRF
jgi:hypothetical protein